MNPLTWLPLALQVVNGIPDCINPQQGNLQGGSKSVHILVLPLSKSLGVSDDDFGNVQVKTCDGEQIMPAEPESVFTCVRGKLGVLQKGLLHIADFERKIEAMDVAKQHVAAVRSKINMKRTA